MTSTPYHTIATQIAKALALDFVSGETTSDNLCFANSSEVRSECKTSFTITDVMDYIYAVKQTATQHENTGTEAITVLSNISYPKDADTFWEIAKLGKAMRRQHLSVFNPQEVYIELFKKDDLANDLFKYAVIATQYNNQWTFVRHRERSTWEIPAGKREAGENILAAAERELIEETGAVKYMLNPLCAYSATVASEKAYGLLCYAEVYEFGTLMFEMEERKTFDALPSNLTYPAIQTKLFEIVQQYKTTGSFPV